MSSTGNKDIILKIEPITRIEGHLGLYVKVSREGKTEDAYTLAIMFRGFEVILKGRRPDSAIFITCRSCGVCGAAHANASVLACDMALGVPPTPLGACLRNLAYAMTDYTYDHSVLLSLLEGPDYSEYILKYTNPTLLEETRSIKCPLADYHGYKTFYEMECGWNPIPKPGLTYALCVYYQRLAKEAGSLIYGKYAHPATLVPGGVCFDNKYLQKLFSYYLERLVYLTMWVKFLIAQWIDMLYLYYTHVEVKQTGLPYARCQGITYDPAIMLSAGLFENPTAELYLREEDMMDYSEVYLGIDDAYNARLQKPGLAVGNNLVYKNFSDLQRNMVELLTSGYYWGLPELMGRYVDHDPAGKPLANGIAELVPYHEWNKETLPHPAPLPEIPEKWELPEKIEGFPFRPPYSWCAEPRMVLPDRTLVPFEVGPMPKMWVNALRINEIVKTFEEAPMVSSVIKIKPTLTGYFPFKPAVSAPPGYTIVLPRYKDLVKLAIDLAKEAKKLLSEAGLPTDSIDIGKLEKLYSTPPPLLNIPGLLDEELNVWWWNEISTTLFRLYGRATSLVMAVVAAWWTLEKLLEVYREGLYKGVGKKWINRPGRPWKFPSYPFFAVGVGWLEAPRGAVRHWIVVKDGKIANYQYHAPTSGNATPKTQMKFVWDVIKADVKAPTHIKGAYLEDLQCLLGPYEAAAYHTYVTEELPPDEWTGLDYVRALRSFDPCIGCAVHLEFANGRRIRKYITPVAWSP